MSSYQSPPMLIVATDDNDSRSTKRDDSDRRIEPSEPGFTPRQPTERTPDPEAGPEADGKRPSTVQKTYAAGLLLLGLPLLLSLLDERKDS